MKKLCVMLAAAACLLTIQPREAHAVKAFADHFVATYVKVDGANKDLVAAAEEAKCNICHVNGKPKKERNDYGMALAKLLDKNDYKPARVKAEAEAVKKELDAAFKKVAEMKNAEGKTFGELIKSGHLPGTAK